jgi:hypothetical protein
MMRMRPGRRCTRTIRAFLVALSILAAGCTMAGRRPESGAANWRTGAAELPEHALLDVLILPFDPGLPEERESRDEDGGLRYPPIRKAESNYFACLLRATLAASKQWGAVEIGPRASQALEVRITGRILRSDGDRLEVEIEAHDATDRRWLKKRYKWTTATTSYLQSGADPYQPLFTEIASDLAAARGRLTDAELADVRTIAELRFAREFSPESFRGYLEEDDGELRIVRLPARDDPMVPLLGEVRGREAMFIATQSGHYERFCGRTRKPYTEWRQLARDEAIAYRKLRRDAWIRRAASIGLIGLTVLAAMKAPSGAREVAVVVGIAGTIGLWVSGSQKQTEADFRRDTLDELNRSFALEVEPMVVEMEGRTVKLTGTVEEQYAEWQRLLRELYEAEAGVPHELDVRILDTAGDAGRDERATDGR